MSHLVKPILPCLVLSAATFGQTQDFTLRVEVPVVSIDVSVVDRTGQPVTGLSPENFKIYENGTQQKIRYFGASNAPYSVYLLFDSSGSTRHKWNFMRRAVAGFAGHIKPHDRISIGIFDENLTSVTEWDSSHKESVKALDYLENRSASGGTTELYKALDYVLKKSLNGINERRAVIVLTDGRDTSLYREVVANNRLMTVEKDREFSRLRKTVAKSGVPIYFIAINTDRNLDDNSQGADEHRNLQILYRNSAIPDQYLKQVRMRMESLAEISGGQTLFPRTIDDVVPLYEQIGQDLGNAYSLGYVPSAQSGKGLRRIVVKVGNETYRIRQSRTGYYSD